MDIRLGRESKGYGNLAIGEGTLRDAAEKSQDKVSLAVAGTSRREGAQGLPWEDEKELELKPKMLFGCQAEVTGGETLLEAA